MSKRFGIILPFIIALSSLCIALPELPVEIDSKLKGFINLFELQKSRLQGGAIAILYKGQVIYKSTFGNQRGSHMPVTPQTLFPLASVSKAVSSTIIALMVERGALSFEEEFQFDYLKYPISLKHIFGHTTGYYFTGNREIEQGTSKKELLAILSKKTPRGEPGKHYFYSNVIFSLIEEVLLSKKLSFRSAIQQLQEELKIDGIQILPFDTSIHIAYPHSTSIIENNYFYKQLPLPAYYPKTIPSAAGVFASLDGMVEIFKLSFGYRPDLISKETLSNIQMPITVNQDPYKWKIKCPYDKSKMESYYGLGWRILKSKVYPQTELVFHGGHVAGVATFIGFVPSQEMGIIILLNQASGFALQRGIRFWTLFFK
jgi:beta-lactamase class C